MKTDMSPHAVTMRLKQTSEFRRLCLALRKRNGKDREEFGSRDDNNLLQKTKAFYAHGELTIPRVCSAPL